MVQIYRTNDYNYPTFPYLPSEEYPEYPFPYENCVSNSAENEVYRAIRENLHMMGLDEENYGTKKWNPLKNFVKQGQTILIKPNLVMDHNENNKYRDNLNCVVTHTSCIRAICDYCIIALGKSGKIVIGDAPMQGCRFDILRNKAHLDDLIDYYGQLGYSIELADLREFQAMQTSGGVIIDKEYTKDNRGICVHLGEQSAHVETGNEKYQVSDYDPDQTQKFHHGKVHDYIISELALHADFIISFSKPKTHRLAGFTGAMKNMVGITFNKASLPHRQAGSPDMGGDAYSSRSVFKSAADWLLIKKLQCESKHRECCALLCRFLYLGFRLFGNFTTKDNSFIGSWPGNDTIWRTVADLNTIMTYADKLGAMQKTPQRNFLFFGDLIIAGEHNGPVAPSPKNTGIIISSNNALEMDTVLCKIMGFRYSDIPLIRNLSGTESSIDLKSNSHASRGSTMNETMRTGVLCNLPNEDIM